MEPVESRQPEQSPGHLGRYELLEKLGQGGMGSVFLARDTKLDRRVAIKFLAEPSAADPAAVARFQREARALAQLSHPGIVQAYDSEAAAGKHFLVMEYVEGTSLAVLLQENGSLPPARAADYIHQAARALGHAHGKGLVHRDLKPSNLLLTPAGQVKLLDLGLARFVQDHVADPGLTREGMGMGTPDYAAPEQYRDAHQADARADIYSLGCTLYHLLTGQVPFPGSSLSEKCQAHQRKEPVPVEELAPDTPGGLALVVRRMMAKWPEDRFQTAGEVAAALAPYLAGSSSSFQALKETLTWHGGQLTMTDWTSRFRVRRWLAFSALVAGVLGLAVFSWFQFFRGDEPNSTSTNNRREEVRKADGPRPSRKTEKDPTSPAARKQKPRRDAKALEAEDPNILTVSQKPAGGGKFRKIGEALGHARPGVTIRVLDEATYEESLLIKGDSTYAGITLEAPRHARLEGKTARVPAIDISDVTEMTVRGFRLRSAAENVPLILVKGQTPGLKLHQLECEPGRPNYSGIEIQASKTPPSSRPIVIWNCTFRRANLGVTVSGIASDGRTPVPSEQVMVCNNSFQNCWCGVLLLGAVRHAQILGNRIWGARLAAIQFQHLLPGAEKILIANNTVFESQLAFRLWDKRVEGKDVEMCNNLFLKGSPVDMVFIETGSDGFQAKGPGDSRRLHQAWKIHHNYRENPKPTGTDLAERSWVPLGKEDVHNKTFPLLSRNRNHPDFLRPASDSPLANAGAGTRDPSLPSYVGALPPPG
ncbi:MAG TPA: serine/threonine-protein kinase, partial [Gemmataceae bacterium]|nr:serine/threonine-protein kinase [Gemmataceae bacterium]